MSSFQKIFFAFIICGSFIWQPQSLLAPQDGDKKFEAMNSDTDLSPTAPPFGQEKPPSYDDVVSPQQGQKQSWGDMFKSWGQKIKRGNPFRKKTEDEKTIKKHRALKRQLKPRIESLETVLKEATTELENATEDQKAIGQKMKAVDGAIKALEDDLFKINTTVEKAERSLKKLLRKIFGQDPASQYQSAKENFLEAQRSFHGRQASDLNLRQTELKERVPKCRAMKKTLEGHLNRICDITKSPDTRYDDFKALTEQQYTQINSDIKKSRELVSVTKENLREFNKLRKKVFTKCNETVNAMGSALKTLLYKWPKAGLKAAYKKLETAAAQTARFGSWLKKKAGEGATKVGLGKKPGGDSSDTVTRLTPTSPPVN